MNERFNQLRLEAGISRLHDEPKFMVAVSKEGTVIEPLDGLEKFAELIVRECIDIASEVRGEPATDTHYVIGYDRACEKMIDGIKEHFGVGQ